MKRLFIPVLFIICLHLQAQKPNGGLQLYPLRYFVDTDNFGKEYLEDLEKSIEKIKTDTIRFMAINDLGYHYHTRNLQKSLEIINQGLEEVRSAENVLWEGRMQASEGAILLRMEELDHAELVLRSALQKIPEAETWFLFTNLGYVYERRGELAKAFEFATETLKLGEKYQNKKAIAIAYSDMSNLFWKQGKFEKGVEYGKKSLALFEERGLHDLDFDFTLHVLGNNLVELHRFNEALPYFQKSAMIGEKYGFYNNLSDTYIALSELYSQTGELEKAEKSGKEALKYAELLQNDFMVTRSLLSLGKLKNQEGNFESSIAYLQSSIRTAGDDFGDMYYLSLMYKELSKAFEGRNNFKESFEAYKKYHELNQLVFNAEADQRIAQLQTEMEVSQKENTILLQMSRLRQQNVIQVFTLVLVGVMLLFLFILYRYFIRRKRYSLILEKQNKEKEFLLKEIHHRVKNNLETISSLLSLQTSQIEDQELHDIMIESQNRVQSMGMIHQNLYQGENLAAIEMKNYFEDLGGFIIDSFNATNRIVLKCEMSPLELDVDRAIPIGLIVNELITNSLKYAFPDKMIGAITICLKETDSHLYLELADNGVGMDKNMDIKGTGFGTQLVQLLTQQLDGKVTLTTHGGTKVFFEFQINSAA
ncbi:tetratricopeptide repeat-containing sensor histidine kinase [Mongoliibacter ruber]|uniref:histidine kinase n=1 Tax=Mongoliibacter ruber TaxID=1750599 RepID=A0A2T0WDG8_9BACT|nr:histidine kinase dimerization/phosphoacceptor domain -containing protein [Mongoliibacter ruber]PRY84741.1 two-component sensor histidine kinase [Mongoliibacter ruber]